MKREKLRKVQIYFPMMQLLLIPTAPNIQINTDEISVKRWFKPRAEYLLEPTTC